jgi:hypothetical protein
MNYLVTYTRKGAVQITAPNPPAAERRARAVLNAGRAADVPGLTILDIIPETCEDCTRAARHTHAGEDGEQNDDADTSLAQRYDAALALLDEWRCLGAAGIADLRNRTREFLR